MTFYFNSQFCLLRSLRSKDNPCWILRLQPLNFKIVPESLAPHLEKLRWTSVWQTVPKFWFIWLCYISFCITYKSTVHMYRICSKMYVCQAHRKHFKFVNSGLVKHLMGNCPSSSYVPVCYLSKEYFTQTVDFRTKMNHVITLQRRYCTVSRHDSRH